MPRENRLYYTAPANTDQWNEALPIGNGRMGAMVFGGTDFERIQFNEDSVWSGGFRDRTNVHAKENIENIRSLIREGKIAQAENLTRYAIGGTPEFQRSYQTLGDLLITFDDMPPDIDGYERELSLEDAVNTTRFTAGGCRYEREVFASAPADLIAVKLWTDNPKGLSFDARLVRPRYSDKTGTIGEDTVYLTYGGAVPFHWLMRGLHTGGKMRAIGEYLIVQGAKEVILYLTAVTRFRSKDTLGDCKSILNKAVSKSYPEIKKEHIADYKAIEGRVSLTLAENNSGEKTDKEPAEERFSRAKKEELPTDERLSRVKAGERDLGLAELYFRFGRYLLIACSRPGTLPANLQGIWCNDYLAPWDSKYTININTQMNYWPAEICNLPECHEPLFEHLWRMHPKGAKVAKAMYGARGFTAHHNTDIWGDCAPQDTWIPASYWPLGAAWLCLHIWEHYQYTLDEDFLGKHYRLLHDTCLFFLDFLIENDKGQLVISPSVSPENAYLTEKGEEGTLCEGCTMDSQILSELFDSYIGASRVLKKKPRFGNEIAKMREKLPPTAIGKDGRIMEWLVGRDEAEPGHRHMSHLFGLFPGNSIDAGCETKLTRAARKTLETRLSHGGGHTGWSRAWIINFYARLGDGNEANFHLSELMRCSTLSNLFDDHPPFQIDGNFGATAAIAHMLVSSSGKGDKIYLLKALPDEWTGGTVRGLCAKGGLIVDVAWRRGRLTEASIYAKADFTGVIVYKNNETFISLGAGEKKTLRPADENGILEVCEV